MIDIQNLKKSYEVGKESLTVLKDLELKIAEGEFVSIMGSSGSGKSTLLNVIGLLDGFDSGKYLLDGEDVSKLKENKAAQIRNRVLGFVFQSFNLLNFKNAIENVALPLYYQGVSRKKRNKRALEFLDQVSMADRGKHIPSELSGGQKQRVALARALVTEPKIILADEPTGALDSKTTNEVMDLFIKINNSGQTIIIVTHEIEIAEMTKRIINISDGKIVE